MGFRGRSNLRWKETVWASATFFPATRPSPPAPPSLARSYSPANHIPAFAPRLGSRVGLRTFSRPALWLNARRLSLRPLPADPPLEPRPPSPPNRSCGPLLPRPALEYAQGPAVARPLSQPRASTAAAQRHRSPARPPAHIRAAASHRRASPAGLFPAAHRSR